MASAPPQHRNNLYSKKHHAWFSDVFRLDDVEDKDGTLLPTLLLMPTLPM